MTTTEPAAPRPVAKQLAQQALEEIGELRAQFGTIIADLREHGAGGPFPPSGLDEKVSELDKEFSEFVDAVNKRFSALGSGEVSAADLAPFEAKLQKLQEETAGHFKAFSKIVDTNNDAAKAAITELREQMPVVADVLNRISELTAKVHLFDEAGVAPASGEDVSSLDGRVKHVEALCNELRSMLAHPSDQPSVDHMLAEMDQRLIEFRQDMNATMDVVGRLRGYLDSPTFAAVERAADRMEPGVTGVRAGVPAVYGQVHELMRLVAQIGKDSQADKKMGGYKFRSIEAVMDAVGIALRDAGVMFQPREIVDKRIERYETVSKDGFRQNWTHVWVTQRYAFVSLIDGSEMAAIEMDGEARDNGDKSTSKADSMRYKYALLQALCIPVNDLPESDGSDGTEGGQVYGRGSAGDAFDNASPARPQEEPQASAPQRETAYGYGHQPAESPGGQAHAQAQQQPDARALQDDRTPAEKATAAYQALVALAGLEKQAQRPNLRRILDKIESDGIGDIVIQKVDGNQCALSTYAAVVNAQVGA